MNKKEYLEELRKELETANVKGIDEIIEEYGEHFDFRSEEGQSEEETAEALYSPKSVAEEFKKATKETDDGEKSGKGVKVAAVAALSVLPLFAYLLACGTVLVLGAFSLASLCLGFCLITTINIGGVIPYIPYFSALVLGLACLSLAVLSAIGVMYDFMYVKQWGVSYIKFCDGIISGGVHPSVTKHPKLSRKKAAALKLIAMISLVAFVALFTIAYASMCIQAKSMAFWHAWHWFE